MPARAVDPRAAEPQALGRGAADPRAAGYRLVPVLLYHDVLPDGNGPARGAGDPWAVRRAELAGHLDAVLASGRRPVTATELADRLRDDPGQAATLCAVTFDDGFASFTELALPLLAERAIPATLYVTTGLLGEPGMLDATAVTQLATHSGKSAHDSGSGRADVELGAHAVRHRHLDLLPLPEARAEIAGSRAGLAELTGRPPASFAYPHGSFTRAVRDLVAAEGFANAYAVKNAFTHVEDDRYALARLTVTRSTGIDQVRAWLAGTGAPRSWRGERLRTTLYRQVRRYRAR